MENTDKLNKKAVERLKKQQEANALREQLTLGPDLLIQSKGSDQALDKINERIELISGKVITIGYVSESASKYFPIFTNGTEYFSEIYRLKGWPIEDAIRYYKHPFVGKITKEIIYGRFLNGILPMLENLNPYIGNSWLREYKHFQFLSEEGKKQVETFISEAVIIMKTCNNWYEFRVKYFVRYHIPFQTDAFEDTDKMIAEYKTKLLF